MFKTIYFYLSLLFFHFQFLFSSSHPFYFHHHVLLFLFLLATRHNLQFTMFDLISLKTVPNITEIKNTSQCTTKENYRVSYFRGTKCFSSLLINFLSFQFLIRLQIRLQKSFFSYRILMDILSMNYQVLGQLPPGKLPSHYEVSLKNNCPHSSKLPPQSTTFELSDSRSEHISPKEDWSFPPKNCQKVGYVCLITKIRLGEISSRKKV